MDSDHGRRPTPDPSSAPDAAPSGQNDRVARFMRVTGPHHARLLRLARALCGDADRAADLTQETLIRAFKAFHRFRPNAPALPWLRRIMKNLHLDMVKSGRARFEVAQHQQRDDREDPCDAAAADAPSPLLLAERAQLTQWACEALAELSDEQQQVLILCDMEALSCREAAELIGLPAGTVRSRLFRGREQLRRRVEARMQGSGKIAEQRDKGDGRS